MDETPEATIVAGARPARPDKTGRDASIAEMAWKNWTEWIAARCEKYSPGARRVLEIGGTGQELGAFLKGREFHALNSPAGDICRPTHFPSGYFDLILSKMALEHFYDPFSAADEITRLLAPGGTLLLVTVWSWRYHTAPGVEDYFRFSVPGLRQLFPRLEEIEAGYDLEGRREDCRMDNVPVDEFGGWREHWPVYLAARKPPLAEAAAPAVRYRMNLSLFGYSLDQVKSAYEAVLAHGQIAAAVSKVMDLGPEGLPAALLGEGQRGLPSESRFVATGYHRMMLGRYVFAGSQFCRGLDVLDSCSGLGWGAFLAAQYARRVTAFDVDPQAVAFAQRTWPGAGIRWLCGDALAPEFLEGEFFDVVLAMETVEHFTLEQGERYVARMAQLVKRGGVLVGTSAFPATQDEAGLLAARNPHHRHIFTQAEFLALLSRHFSRAAIAGGWMFLALR